MNNSLAFSQKIGCGRKITVGPHLDLFGGQKKKKGVGKGDKKDVRKSQAPKKEVAKATLFQRFSGISVRNFGE